MTDTILIDTNLYLDDPNIIHKLSVDYDKVLIPHTVLKELDKHKFNPDLSYSARNAIGAILEFVKSNRDRIIFDTNKYEEINEPDEKILEAALAYEAAVATKDVSMSIIARAKGLKADLHDVVLNNIFKPYSYIKMEDLHEATQPSVFSYQPEYNGVDYGEVVDIFSKLSGRELIKDSWFYVFIDIGQKCPAIYANNPMKKIIERIDINRKYREIRVEDTVIKAIDEYQVCAVYAMENAPHCLITGRWGSGKTLLSTAHALSKNRKKTFITRAPLGLNAKYNLGFMPGDKKDKMMDWLQGFMSALYFIKGNTREDGGYNEDGKGGYDYVKEEAFDKSFEIIAMNAIQGLSLLSGDTMIVDEAQLITVDYMSMILSRPSDSGKLILMGDIKQTYDVVKPSESGLLKLLRVLPHKYMAYVELQNSYRSPLLELADKLQDRSIK